MRLLAFVIFLSAAIDTHCQQNFTWRDAQKNKKGTITIFWFPNNPFGFEEPGGRLTGIEVEIMRLFQQYLKSKHGVHVEINWVPQQTFKQVLDHMRYDSLSGVFGVAGFSFTEERKTFMKFSPSYMADMAVLVSTNDIPVVRNQQDLQKSFTGATALTAQGTILEKELLALRQENNLDFDIEYTGGSALLIDLLQTRKKSFGYLNLPVYLMGINNGITTLHRHNYLTKRYEGRGIGMPKVSDWDEPLNEFFLSVEFQSQIEELIGRYINLELYHFVETLTPENEISLLNREKSIQTMQLKYQELALQEKNEKLIFLGSTVVAISALLLMSAYLYRQQKKSRLLLLQQKVEIEAQAKHIQSINDSLEAAVQSRTKELQEKNKALADYAFITAHKLRAPLSSILGLVNLMHRVNLPDEEKILVTHLLTASEKLDAIVHEVMKSVEAPKDISSNKNDKQL